ncbi:ABC transporter permease [Dyadobacter sandarakinus]|uniref:ABC transporter permease n=1 Tax=Dyadobacter sandarakinus TaxID=2747268 RepID=A0ABX7I3Y2_9BACT|nr:ABC transporter permease [Dyadobacter sandarakinus]QRR00791.1 ABC transporter permease [Dyadobacter sandarakinus]
MLTFALIRNQFKTASRHLLKERQFSLLNTIGLSSGLASALLIGLWVHDEFAFDKFHEKDSRLYEVMIHEKIGDGIATTNSTGEYIGETILNTMPEVETAVMTTPAAWFQRFSISYGSNTVSAIGNFASKDYFHAFSFPLVQGNKQEVLTNRKSIAISEKLATQLFHSPERAMGKVLEWKWQAYSEKCLISGVFKNFPKNSSQQYDFLLSMDAWNQIVPPGTTQSAGGPFDNFIVLKEGADIRLLNKKIAALANTNFNDPTSRFFLRKYSDAYLFGSYQNGVQAGGKITYVRLFTIVAIIILIIACINFMNQSTAKASMRIREVGVKKALGAGRSTLIVQFLSESLILSFLALIIALLITWALLPVFNNITGKDLPLQLELGGLVTILGIAFVMGLLAGSYPAFYLSRFNPAFSLKGGLTNSFSELILRKGLVIFQFTVSAVFIISVLVVYQQIHFLQHKNLGYDKDNVIYFEMEGRVAMQGEAFLSQLKNLPGVINASSIQQKIILPDMLPGNGSGVRWDGKNADDKIRFFRMPVNFNLIETMGIKITSGRSFSRKYGAESSNIILNEAAVKAMELSEPVGKTVMFGDVEKHIVGVAKDFHFNSLHNEIRPFILYLSPQETMLVMAKINAGKEQETITRIQDFYKTFNPGYSFNYRFLDHDFQVQYASEKLVNELARYFAVLAIIISCLGLYGLAAFTANRRKKEIGVRKVLGATVSNVVSMLTKDFLILALIAVCIAFPVAWWLMDQWLQTFAYHIYINYIVFIGAAILIILITLLTIGYQSFTAALMNPTQALRND